MRELDFMEIEAVSGGGWEQSAGALAAMTGIGVATFGSTWGAVAVGVAFATAPIAVGAIGALGLYAGLCLWFD